MESGMHSMWMQESFLHFIK